MERSGNQSAASASIIRNLGEFTAFTDDENAALEGLLNEPVRVGSRTEILFEGDRKESAYAILDGWAFCYKSTEDGGRQVINFQMPGDFLGIRSLILRIADHGFSTITDCQLVRIRKEDWIKVFDSHPRVGYAVLWSIARDEALLVEHLVNLGQRSGEERTANLLSELGYRLETRGLLTGNTFDCPISQSLMADWLGVSIVHLNRKLRALRDKGLIESGRPGVRVLDYMRLRKFAEFDSNYLQQRPQ